MNKNTVFFVFALVVFLFCWTQTAFSDEYYRTYEIIGLNENSLTLQDNDGNIIEVNEDPEGFRLGYNVRYDSVRKRLRKYRWQEYEVIDITDDSITMRHKTGDILSVNGNFSREFKIGDQVRYDSVDQKLQLNENKGQWKQYHVSKASKDSITLISKTGQEVVLHLDNNIYKAPRGLFIARYKVGDQVRYNAATNQLRKGIIRTYDWQNYAVKEVNEKQITLVNKNREEMILDNTFSGDFQVGDKVKYDRLNNLLKAAR